MSTIEDSLRTEVHRFFDLTSDYVEMSSIWLNDRRMVLTSTEPPEPGIERVHLSKFRDPRPIAKPGGYQEAPLISEIKDTTGLIDWDVCYQDLYDSTLAIFCRDGYIVARIPRELVFEYYVAKSDRTRASQ